MDANLTTQTRILGTVALVATLLLPAAAQAQLFRAYLAVDGSDANPCTLVAPCRLLPAALAAVASGGEIWMLDTANYNTAPVTVGKSVSILAAPGVVGSIVATGGPAIAISAAGLSVALRNVVIVPLLGTGGTHGVDLTGNSNLVVEDSVFAGMTSSMYGINAAAGTARITNTSFRNMATTAVGATNGARVHISRSSFLNLTRGVFVQSTSNGVTSKATVSDSAFSGNTYGVWANATTAGAVAHLFLTRCTLDDNGSAITSNTAVGTGIAVVSMSYTTVTGNTVAWFIDAAGAAVHSLSNNHVAGNLSETGALTMAPALR